MSPFEALRTIRRINALVDAGYRERAAQEIDRLPLWAIRLALVLMNLGSAVQWLRG